MKLCIYLFIFVFMVIAGLGNAPVDAKQVGKEESAVAKPATVPAKQVGKEESAVAKPATVPAKQVGKEESAVAKPATVPVSVKKKASRTSKVTPALKKAKPALASEVKPVQPAPAVAKQQSAKKLQKPVSALKKKPAPPATATKQKSAEKDKPQKQQNQQDQKIVVSAALKQFKLIYSKSKVTIKGYKLYKLNLSLQRKQCNAHIIDKFNKEMTEFVQKQKKNNFSENKAEKTTSSENADENQAVVNISVQIGEEKYFIDSQSKAGKSFFALPQKIEKMKQEEKLSCDKKASAGVKKI